MIPLHAGCSVFVSKMDLVMIFTPVPSIYTSRLMEIIFTPEELADCMKYKKKDRVNVLDKERVNSLITHVVQVFTRRGENISDETVKKFLSMRLTKPPKRVKDN